MTLDRLRGPLQQWEKQGLRRYIRSSSQGTGRVFVHEGRSFLNFASNNYLGLAEDPRLRAALVRGAEDYGVGSGASRLVTGSFDIFEKLEEQLARWKGCESALLFNSGYLANLGMLSSLVGVDDWIFSDELNHASMIDGIRLSRARVKIFRHNDMNQLERQLREARLQANADARFLIATESVFSMEGDLAPLRDLLDLSLAWNAWLYVDEAHGAGIFGVQGSGCLDEFREHPAFRDRVIAMGTLGKALGCFGAYVAGTGSLKDYALHRARSFVYSTALPPALAYAVQESLRIVQTESWRREQLWRRIDFFSRALEKVLNRPGFRAFSPIIPVGIGAPERALKIADHLRECGFWITAMRPPTVPEGSSRLRITLMCDHTEEDLHRLATVLREELEHE